MTVTMTDGHMSQIIKLSRQKKMTPERWTSVLASPIFAALLDARADLGNPDGVLAMLGMPKNRKERRAQKQETVKPDNIIHVDRSTKPVYPDWVTQVMYPHEEQTGPTSFNVTKLDHYLYGEQNTGGSETGNAVHEHLIDAGLIKTCLNLQDLLAIQAKGIEFFRAHFKGKVVFAWKSVVRDRNDDLRVPYLIVFVGQVVLDWDWLDHDWDGSGPALRFAS